MLIAMLASGCGVSRKGVHTPEGRAQGAAQEVRVDAYLFDAKLHRNGKPTSFRLEMFRTDSVIALAGRAYLGKGALRGRMTRDSLEIYFPSSNEFLYCSLVGAVSGLRCDIKTNHIDLLHALTTLPDTATFSDPFLLTSDTSDQHRRSYALWIKDCPWQMKLTYDKIKEQWQLREFKFSSGSGTELHAERREYRSDVSLPAERFSVHYPSDAARIEP
jgi:hypothetical protein